MQIRPISSYKAPGLPTKDILDEHPELLRLVPRRWRGNAVVLSALAGVCVLMSAGRGEAKEKAVANGFRIAPVFEHGAGRGVVGCSAVNPPVFLSEAEARQVIVEEGKRAGIIFTADGKTLPKMTLPRPSMIEPRIQPETPDPTTQIADLVLDGADLRRNISYEYVSEDDFRDLYGRKRPVPLAGAINTLDVAFGIREELIKSKPKGTYAVFYDPETGEFGDKDPGDPKAGIDWKQPWQERHAEIRKQSAEQLRAQVRDFVKWLKAQGVI